MNRCTVTGLLLASLLTLGGTMAAAERAPLPIESLGTVEKLPPFERHWVFIPDRLLQHSALFDGDEGRMLGTIPSTNMLTPKLPLLSRERNEIYSVDLDYDRGVRGNRIDFITIYDAQSLEVTGEVVLPNPTSESNTSLHHATLLDGERFLIVFSQFPKTVATVVDMHARAVVGEVQLAGCAGVYAAGPNRFGSLCGDGTAVLATIDENGAFAELTRSPTFFDVVEDAVMMAGARDAQAWWFVSFKGQVYRVTFSGPRPEAEPAWAMTAGSDPGWRPGGLQPVALSAELRRLYVLAHEGAAGTHKDAGPEVWVFDLVSGEKTATFEVPNMDGAFLGSMLGLDPAGLGQSALSFLVPSGGALSIAVTQDDTPLLFMRNGESGVAAVLDAKTGEHLRNLSGIGLTGPTLGVY